MPKRRRRRPVRTLLLILLLVLAVLIVLMRFVFVVRNVEVEGNTGTISRESIVRTARAGLGESIFGVDQEGIESRINAMGILKVQDVRVRYPDTVLISVERRSRDAMLLHMGKIRVLDDQGYVVESLDQVPNEDIIYVSGMRVQGFSIGDVLQVDADQLAAYRTMIPAIRSRGASPYVSELDLGDVRHMRIITRKGIIVELGDKEKAEDKIAWMMSAVADLERRGETGGILDVSSGTKADYRMAR